MSRPRTTHCKRGHAWIPENIYVHAKTGNRFCRTCHREYQKADRDNRANWPPERLARYEARIRAAHARARARERERRAAAPPKPRRAACPQGHAYTPENSIVDNLGRRFCRACHQAANRRLQERKRRAAIVSRRETFRAPATLRLPPRHGRAGLIDRAIAAICLAFDVAPDALISPVRYRELAHARHAAAALLRDEKLTQTEIALALGRRDHTTIHHSLWQAGRLRHNPEWARSFDRAVALFASDAEGPAALAS